MRIAHVVTLISVDNAFGGPVSVAKAQAAELASRGHEVSLLAGWDGIATASVPGVDVRLHRVRRLPGLPGFFGLIAPSMVRELRRLAPALDVLHLHLARDIVTLSVGAATVGRPRVFVTQTHGMVMPDHRLVARVVDTLATRRVLRSATANAALTDVERTGLLDVARGPLRTLQLSNGIGLRTDARPAVGSSVPDVVFCARLHPRKRVLAFAEMAALIVRSGRQANFVVAGPDEGDLAPLRHFIDEHGLQEHVRYVGAVEPGDVRDFLAGAAVFVLPSEREPFPMTLLEAMAEGTPSVITDGCMMADRVAGTGGPIVTDGSASDLAAAVAQLLDDPAAAAAVGKRSRELVVQDFGIAAVVDQLEAIYAGTAPRT